MEDLFNNVTIVFCPILGVALLCYFLKRKLFSFTKMEVNCASAIEKTDNEITNVDSSNEPSQVEKELAKIKNPNAFSVYNENKKEFMDIRSSIIRALLRRQLRALIDCGKDNDYCFNFLSEQKIEGELAARLISESEQLTGLLSIGTFTCPFFTFKCPADWELDLQLLRGGYVAATEEENHNIVIIGSSEPPANSFDQVILETLRGIEKTYKFEVAAISKLANWGNFSGEGIEFFGQVSISEGSWRDIFGKIFCFCYADHYFLISTTGAESCKDEYVRDENGNILTDELSINNSFRTKYNNFYALTLIEHSFQPK